MVYFYIVELKRMKQLYLSAALALASAFAFPVPAAAARAPIAWDQRLQLGRNVLPRAGHDRHQVARVLAVFGRVEECDGVAGVVPAPGAANPVHVVFDRSVPAGEVVVDLGVVQATK